MHKVWLIFKREYLTRVRTKGFVVATIAIPLFSIGIFAFSIFMATRKNDHSTRIAILDNAGGLASTITDGLDSKLPNGQPAFQVTKTIDRPASEEGARKELLDGVKAGTLDGYLVLPRDSAAKGAEFHTKNTGDFSLEGNLEQAVSDAVAGNFPCFPLRSCHRHTNTHTHTCQ